jgi:hypothetical protein
VTKTFLAPKLSRAKLKKNNIPHFLNRPYINSYKGCYSTRYLLILNAPEMEKIKIMRLHYRYFWRLRLPVQGTGEWKKLLNVLPKRYRTV